MASPFYIKSLFSSDPKSGPRVDASGFPLEETTPDKLGQTLAKATDPLGLLMTSHFILKGTVAGTKVVAGMPTLIFISSPYQFEMRFPRSFASKAASVRRGQSVVVTGKFAAISTSPPPVVAFEAIASDVTEAKR